jgi:ATP-dependent DNA ligase
MGARLPAVHPPVQLMAAKTVDHFPTEPGWSFEPKFDGFQTLAFQRPKGVDRVRSGSARIQSIRARSSGR